MDDISHVDYMSALSNGDVRDLLFRNMKIDQFVPCLRVLLTARTWAEDDSKKLSTWIQARFGKICKGCFYGYSSGYGDWIMR